MGHKSHTVVSAPLLIGFVLPFITVIAAVDCKESELDQASVAM
jgi:hypothetical protein